MAEKKHNLYTVIEEALSAPTAKKSRQRTDKEQEKFNLYTAMGWVAPSKPNKKRK